MFSERSQTRDLFETCSRMLLLASFLADVLSVSRISTELVDANQETSGPHQHLLSSSRALVRRGDSPWHPSRSSAFCVINPEN